MNKCFSMNDKPKIVEMIIFNFLVVEAPFGVGPRQQESEHQQKRRNPSRDFVKSQNFSLFIR